ncbi:hypothetical protein Bhyg_00155 [Pseudolycoriella hygida]|uniref:Uncharacterized protein n=1 Tax=Pseudolycoriella hygida TaxID=35572 RepID=A0A9Q0N772_9DIPT|nr:hypothetical protein Bhyg_00155 [Pseudolycoriella hygida]
MDSFPTICGFKENSAIIHYRATCMQAKKITGNGLLLIDSGAQYKGCTTDITRTFSIGKATAEQKLRYTQVLKGHIALSMIKFPVDKVTGSNLDILARQFLWQDEEDYPHSTGHGVGSFLNVHEGPQGISLRNNIILKAGMVVSNEPGYYKTGEFAIFPEDMQIEYEQLAQQLIKSGKLRIDTDDSSNFARFSDPKFNISCMVSKEELTDPQLIPQTNKLLRSLYKSAISEDKLASIYRNLRNQIQKLQPVNPEITVKLTRILVQAAHPIVIRWLLHDKVQVFITYSHNIGDMMDIVDWQRSGSNSGMQSTDGKNVAVFVSCGGDPFADNNKDHPTLGDGWAAVARLQIIAGQELGHFADIKRDANGRQISRHSANFAGTKATPHVKSARRNDLINCDKLFAELLRLGMKKMIYYEEKVKFYDKNNVKGLKYYQRYMGLMLKVLIDDMKFNLAPVADVYKHSNPEIEETIACVEALARVPQQVMKWGYLATMETMRELYKIYYNEYLKIQVSY